MPRKLSIALFCFWLFIPLHSFAKELIPMGHSIGVQLQMPYVFVSHDVLLSSGEWLKQGERISKVNDKTFTDIDTLTSYDASVNLTIEHAGSTRVVKVSQDQLTPQRLVPQKPHASHIVRSFRHSLVYHQGIHNTYALLFHGVSVLLYYFR